MKCDECKHRESCEYAPNCESYEIDIEVHDEIIRGDIIAELEEQRVFHNKSVNNAEIFVECRRKMEKDINEPIKSMLVREYNKAIDEFIVWAYINGIDFSFTGKIKEDGTFDVFERLETIKQRFWNRKQSEDIE